MQVLLINPFPENSYGINEATIEPPLGLAYLASYLIQYGYKCQIIDANILRIRSIDLSKHIHLDCPSLIGISANIVTIKSSYKIAKVLKMRYPDVPIVLGGPYPSSTPERCLKEKYIDAVVVGEGEITLKEIVDRIKHQKRNLFKNVAGVIYKRNGTIIKNSSRELIQDLDAFPLPAYHLLPHLNSYKSRAIKKPVGAIITSRGCPYQCVYCNRSIFGYKFRYRSAESVIREIEYLVDKFGIKQLDILDDNFAMKRDRLVNILDMIVQKKIKIFINIQNGIRVDKVDEELMLKMKEAGVYKMSFGVESGDQNILISIKKMINLDKVMKVNRMAKKHGFMTYGNFMLGLPGDNEVSMQKTIDFAKTMNPHIANFMITIPFPGTELYELIERKGTFLMDTAEGIERGFYGAEVFYELEGMSKELVIAYYKKAYRAFYLRPRKIFELLTEMRSLSELSWMVNASWDILRSIFMKNPN